MTKRSIGLLVCVGLAAFGAGCKRRKEPTPRAKQDAAARVAADAPAATDPAVTVDAAAVAPAGAAAAAAAAEALWQDASNKDLVNPLIWNNVTLALVTTPRKEPDRIGGTLTATTGDGETTKLADWEIHSDVDHWAYVATKGTEAALRYGWAMNVKTKDPGAENFVELVFDKKAKTVVAKRTWSGTRMDKEPAWAKGYVKVVQ